jgi:DNA-binding PadR family transcriptional regulator
MEKKKWVEAEWGTSELGRRVKLYRLTRTGRDQLTSDTAAWRAFAAAVTRVLVKV